MAKAEVEGVHLKVYPRGGVGGQDGQQPGLGNPAPFVVMEDLPIVVPINLPIMPM